MGNTSKRYSAELQERAVHLFQEHVHDYPTLWAAMQSIAGKIGCMAETLRSWVVKTEAAADLAATPLWPTANQSSRCRGRTPSFRARGPWRSLDAVEYATLERVDWCNNCPPLAPIGHVPPAEFEAEYYRQQSGLAIAARPKPEALRRTRGGSDSAHL